MGQTFFAHFCEIFPHAIINDDCIINGIASNINSKLCWVTKGYFEGSSLAGGFFNKIVLDEAGRNNFNNSILGKDGLITSDSGNELVYYNRFEGFLDEKIWRRMY